MNTKARRRQPGRIYKDYGGVTRQAVSARAVRLRRKLAGLCLLCGKEATDIRRNGKPYLYCPACREKKRASYRRIAVSRPPKPKRVPPPIVARDRTMFKNPPLDGAGKKYLAKFAKTPGFELSQIQP